MINLVEDTIDHSDIDALRQWLQEYPRLTQGAQVLAFEKEWSEYIGVKHSVFVNSGSSANFLALNCLLESHHISSGDQVIVPALGWISDLVPVMKLGLTPKICDVSIDNLAIDVEALKNCIAHYDPKVLILVSVLGLVPDMKEIISICAEKDILIIEDVCESVGSGTSISSSPFTGRKLGGFGSLSVFSFYFGHHISTIEGGMICTNDSSLAYELRLSRSHGWARELPSDVAAQYKVDWKTSDFNEAFTFYRPGFNLRSTDLQAFIGRRQLLKLPKRVMKRERNFWIYHDVLSDLKDFWLPKVGFSDIVSNFAYPVITEKRDQLVEKLKKVAEVRPLIAGSLGRQPAYTRTYGTVDCPVADRVLREGCYLPNHPGMVDADIEQICDVIREFSDAM